MKKKMLIVLGSLLLILSISALYLIIAKRAMAPSRTGDPGTNQAKSSSTTNKAKPVSPNGYYNPVAEFKKHVTKKPFGIYITPQNSPIQPERFSGFHTGIDVEYESVEKEVPVRAIANGTVTYSGRISGYGGVALITHKIGGVNRTVVYGHLDPESLPKSGSDVAAGQVIGRLGKGYSNETDSERKHLHFAILSDNRQDFRGYVQSQAELSGWLNPLSLY